MCQQQSTDPQGRPALALELAKQGIQFGLLLNLQVTWAAAFALPWGLAAAGAAATKTLVDAGDVPGSARATALMVKLGLTNLVRDIVVQLSHQKRSDVVAQITIGLLEQGEFTVVSEINNALIAGGYMTESADIAGVLGSRVSNSFFNSLKDAGANLLPNLWPSQSSPASSSAAESTHGLDDFAIDSKKGLLQDEEFSTA